MNKIEINYYKVLLNLVKKSEKINEIPVGSIVISNNKIIGKGYNNRQNKMNVCGHAEINAIIKAEKKMKDWRLSDCTLITTLEPCEMCYEVIKTSRIKNTFYLIDQSSSKKKINCFKINEDNEYIRNINDIFKNFFKKLR